jgi:cell division protein FtsX
MARLNWQLVCWSSSMSKITEASRDHIADETFAFPKERKEPIHDAAHVRNAIARFKQVQGVTEAERDEAWKRIKSAAKKHKVELNERDWRELS